MGKLIESTHVALGGEIDPLDWAFPYLDDDHMRYATEVLDGASALLLGRKTYEGLSAAYPAMAASPFVDRMNSIPKFVASLTLTLAGTPPSSTATLSSSSPTSSAGRAATS
jgi:dihydrofolate reductase